MQMWALAVGQEEQTFISRLARLLSEWTQCHSLHSPLAHTRAQTRRHTNFIALQRASLKLSKGRGQGREKNKQTNKHWIFGKAEQTAKATGVHVWQLWCTQTAPIFQNADFNCDTKMYSHNLLLWHKNRHPLYTHTVDTQTFPCLLQQ